MRHLDKYQNTRIRILRYTIFEQEPTFQLITVGSNLEVRSVGVAPEAELLISSVEADIPRKEEDKPTAQTTEAWLLTLWERVEEVEGDTEEAF
jgi:hypothetical protein